MSAFQPVDSMATYSSKAVATSSAVVAVVIVSAPWRSNRLRALRRPARRFLLVAANQSSPVAVVSMTEWPPYWVSVSSPEAEAVASVRNPMPGRSPLSDSTSSGSPASAAATRSACRSAAGARRGWTSPSVTRSLASTRTRSGPKRRTLTRKGMTARGPSPSSARNQRASSPWASSVSAWAHSASWRCDSAVTCAARAVQAGPTTAHWRGPRKICVRTAAR